MLTYKTTYVYLNHMKTTQGTRSISIAAGRG